MDDFRLSFKDLTLHENTKVKITFEQNFFPFNIFMYNQFLMI